MITLGILSQIQQENNINFTHKQVEITYKFQIQSVDFISIQTFSWRRFVII